MQWTSAPNIGEAPLPQRARSYWKARFSAAHEGLERLLEAERAQLPPWFVVGFGGGIAAWFGLGSDLQRKMFLCLAAAGAVAGFGLVVGRAGRALGWFVLAAMLGCALVWARAHGVEQPRLGRPVVTEVSATVQSVTASPTASVSTPGARRPLSSGGSGPQGVLGSVRGAGHSVGARNCGWRDRAGSCCLRDGTS